MHHESCVATVGRHLQCQPGTPSPPTIAATCEPCPWQSSLLLPLYTASNPCTARVRCVMGSTNSVCVVLMPVSKMYTCTPVPAQKGAGTRGEHSVCSSRCGSMVVAQPLQGGLTKQAGAAAEL